MISDRRSNVPRNARTWIAVGLVLVSLALAAAAFAIVKHDGSETINAPIRTRTTASVADANDPLRVESLINNPQAPPLTLAYESVRLPNVRLNDSADAQLKGLRFVWTGQAVDWKVEWSSVDPWEPIAALAYDQLVQDGWGDAFTSAFDRQLSAPDGAIAGTIFDFNRPRNPQLPTLSLSVFGMQDGSTFVTLRISSVVRFNDTYPNPEGFAFDWLDDIALPKGGTLSNVELDALDHTPATTTSNKYTISARWAFGNANCEDVKAFYLEDDSLPTWADRGTEVSFLNGDMRVNFSAPGGVAGSVFVSNEGTPGCRVVFSTDLGEI